MTSFVEFMSSEGSCLGFEIEERGENGGEKKTAKAKAAVPIISGSQHVSWAVLHSCQSGSLHILLKHVNPGIMRVLRKTEPRPPGPRLIVLAGRLEIPHCLRQCHLVKASRCLLAGMQMYAPFPTEICFHPNDQVSHFSKLPARLSGAEVVNPGLMGAKA